MSNGKQERWADVEGFPGYRVSSAGTVIGPKGSPIGTVGTRGYRKVALMRDGRAHTRLNHRLVLEAFVGKRPPEMQACRHLDGNKLNNQLENLCWGTAAENMADTVRMGRVAKGDASGPRKGIASRPRGDNHPARRIDGLQRGSNNGHATLTEADIPVIRARAERESYCAIAADYQLTPENIGLIARRQTWRHVE
jgi:hypothetical protein